jgi:type II secretory pathway component PulK
MPRFSRKLQNERGTALVLVLIMLALMSILGAMALDTASIEVKVSGNYRAAQEALFAADRGATYALANLEDGLDLDTVKDAIKVPQGGGLDTEKANGADLLATMAAPAGSKSDVTTESGFQAQYYSIGVHGAFPDATRPYPARSEIESQVAKIVVRP